jgi:hypothetical protein
MTTHFVLNKNCKNIFFLIFLLWFIFSLSGLFAGDKNGIVSDKYKSKNSPHLLKRMEDFQIYERTAIHNGNLVHTTFSNYGNLGSRHFVPKMEWPKGSGRQYGFEFCSIVGAEVVDSSGTVLHILSERYSGSGSSDISEDGTHWWGWTALPGYFNDGGISTVGIPEDLNGNGVLDIGEDINNNGLLDSYMENVRNQVATSDYPPSWPTWWPNRDDFWNGKWNGEYGAYSRADQESFYLMDDRYNDEFAYFPYIGSSVDSAGYPDGRRGLGVEVEVRGYQWSHPMAEDILITIYDIRNVSHKVLSKVSFGMYVDADVGGKGGETVDDAASFNRLDDITYQWDLDGLDENAKEIGYFGFAFLESPGEPLDGIDNDEDGMVDESQNDGEDNDGDWTPFDDLNHNGVWDSEDLNSNAELDSVEDVNSNGILDIEPLNNDLGSDGLGPDFEEYLGPDEDGSQGNGLPDVGEPNFEAADNDESDQIGLTSWVSLGPGGSINDEVWWQRLTPETFTAPDQQGYDITYTYGSGFIQLPITERITEQVGEVTRIVDVTRDEMRRFSIACLFGNDLEDVLRNKRTMQTIYDNDYNFTKPPLKPKLVARPGDRKVYLYWDTRSERSNDPVYGKDFEGYKLYRSTDPQFNEIKTITDVHGNPLLWKPIVQWDLKNGLKGSHPVETGETGLLYYMGDDTGLKHFYVDEEVENGRAYYYALCAYDMGFANTFYDMGLPVKLPESVFEISPTENTKIITVDALGNVIATDINTVMVVPNAPAAGYVPAQTEGGVHHLAGTGTGNVQMRITEPNVLKDNHTYQITFSDSGRFFIADSIRIEDVTDFRVLFESGGLFDAAEGEKVLDQLEGQVFDGFKLDIKNDYQIEVLDGYWDKGGESNFNIIITGPSADDTDPKTERFPFDFEIRFNGPRSDTTWSVNRQFKLPVDFQIWDISNDQPMDFTFDLIKMGQEGTVPDTIFSPGDIYVLIMNPTRRSYEYESWNIIVKAPADLDSSEWIEPSIGDIYRVLVSRPFRHEDVFEFTMLMPRMDLSSAKNKMDNIYVVPDPYVVAASWEQPHSFGSGRGERRVDFVNLPQKCTIKIFTPSGKLVRTLEHETAEINGTERWDLLSKDGLTVSYGIYLFNVDAPGIGTKIGQFAIIK